MTTCSDLVELLADYLEGELSPAEVETLRRHLADCVRCQTHVEQMRATIRVLGSIGRERLSAQASQRLLGVYRQWAQDWGRQ